MDVVKLYPQYNIIHERRIQKEPISPISFDRRSGHERRNDERIKLDTNLTRDIFEIKGKVAKLQKLDNNDTKVNFSQNLTRAAQNAIKTDQFIKTPTPNLVDSTKEVNKAKSQTGAVAGVLAVFLGGAFAATTLGVVGAGLAIAAGAYFGGKLLKNAIVSHLKDK